MKFSDHEALLIAWNVEGIGIVEQRRRLAGMGVKASRQALYDFRTRHRDGIEKPKARVAAAVVAKAARTSIAVKSERIRRASIASDKVLEWVETHGLISETQTTGDDDEQITDRRFNRGIVSALVDLNTYVSKELGEFQPETAPPLIERPEHGFSTLILGDSAVRELAQHLFAAMGARDAGGVGAVLQPRSVGAVAPPDDGQ